jgi:hypothetical protein
MKYTVTWLKGAQNHLATIWVDATDKQAVTDAANAIDAELSANAEQKGTPVAEGLRGLYIPPIHVLFTVKEQDRLVELVSVRADSPPNDSQSNGAVHPAGE